jgi:hypothetical protein
MRKGKSCLCPHGDYVQGRQHYSSSQFTALLYGCSFSFFVHTQAACVLPPQSWRSLTRCTAPSPCPAIYKPRSWEIPIKQTLGFDAQVEQCHISAAFSMLPVNPVQKVGLRKRSSQHDSQSEPLEKQVKARRANSATKQEKDSWHGISSRVTNFLPNHFLTPGVSGEILQ